MAGRIMKMLGFRNSNDGTINKTDEENEAVDDIIIVENFKALSPKGDKSLAVNLLKKTYEKQKCERLTKADGDIDINHKGLAPICGAESNFSMGSAQSLPNFKNQAEYKSYNPADDSTLVRETQSCELLNVEHEIIKNALLRKTLSFASASKIKEDSNILRNIRKREAVNAIKTNSCNSVSFSSSLNNCIKNGKKTENTFTIPVNEMYNPDWKDSQFVRELLDWHNLLRGRHGVKQLQLDVDLCKMAQKWANFLAHTNEFYYQNPLEFGENLLLWPMPILPPSSLTKKCPDVTGRYVATYWYRSHSTYPYHADPDVMQSYASAFSQMVWAASEKFGCGKARSSNGKVIVVAYYYPRGNIPDKFHLNVIQPRETCEMNE